MGGGWDAGSKPYLSRGIVAFKQWQNAKHENILWQHNVFGGGNAQTQASRFPKREVSLNGQTRNLRPSRASLGDGLLCSIGFQRDEAKLQAFSPAQDLNLGTMPGRPMINS